MLSSEHIVYVHFYEFKELKQTISLTEGTYLGENIICKIFTHPWWFELCRIYLWNVIMLTPLLQASHQLIRLMQDMVLH